MFKTNFPSSSTAGFKTTFSEYEVIKGEDGFSPDVNVVEIDEGYNITITDKDEQFSFVVKNGKDGVDGKDGHTTIKDTTGALDESKI